MAGQGAINTAGSATAFTRDLCIHALYSVNGECSKHTVIPHTCTVSAPSADILQVWDYGSLNTSGGNCRRWLPEKNDTVFF